MKKSILLSFTSLLLCTSCTNTVAILSKKASDFGVFLKSRALTYLEGDLSENKAAYTSAEFFGAANEEFIPLDEAEVNGTIAYTSTPQPSFTPGTKESLIPGIDMFKDPKDISGGIFKRIHFDTDQYTPNSAEAKQTLQKIANYLKKHPKTYVFVEGHCDKRASESYNQALGTKRSGTIRTILVNYGVNPNQLFSISYGKEKPVALGNTNSDFAKNRRVAFKIYSKDEK